MALSLSWSTPPPIPQQQQCHVKVSQLAPTDDAADQVDKATTDRNARILRDLVKQPDNKNCADCRKNGMCGLYPRGLMLMN
jgi:hypothetical protein